LTKKNILHIATEEFSKYGYDAVSMNKLAAKLEVNKATIYYHFKDKKSLYQEVIVSLMQKNRQKEYDILNSNLTPKEKFFEIINVTISEFKDSPEIIPIILREMANKGSNLENIIIEKEIAEYLDILSKIILQLNLKEKYKDADISIIHSLILGTLTTYFCMQMSSIGDNLLKDFGKNKNNVLNYSGDFISNILFDALCIN